MVRTIQIPGDQIKVNGDQIQVHADLGSTEIMGATFTVRDKLANDPADASDPSTMPFDEWERNFNEIIKIAPLNQYPCDDSREAIYGPDPGQDEPE